MPSQTTVNEILKGLRTICSGEAAGVGLDLAPDGEFRFRPRCSKDRIFRVRQFQGKSKIAEHDGGPGRGGIDLLGKYTLSDSMVTIYVDSCRKVVGRKYCGVDSLETLIEVVLIHELAHLITHQVYDLLGNEDESSHIWEHTAQCATYAYIKAPFSHYSKDYERGLFGLSVLKTFEELSPLQPFIYRTWEVYRTWNDLKDQTRVQGFLNMVKNIQTICALTPKPEQPVPGKEDMHNPLNFENY